MAQSELHRSVRPGELAAAISMVFGMASVSAGWIFLPPLIGITLAVVGRKRSVGGEAGQLARSLAKIGFVLSAGGLLGWIGWLVFVL